MVKKTTGKLVDENKRQLIAKGEVITPELLDSVPFEYLKDLQVGDDKLQMKLVVS